MTTIETRNEAFAEVLARKRQKEIIEILSENKDGLTAKECAYALFRKKYIPSSERNYAAPRLNELLKSGTVKVVGKKKCKWTGKAVSIFALVD